ncbi:DUF2933 domain-containing protein [Micromonospora sp. NPDC048930]|uniref:DUF2933 domain-containing protein n=1 Tax=Micromonospora sp. NPDC048930 TaxID=3364261 RepID=UPI00371630F0
MRRQHLPLYVTALAILVIGALAVGVPARSLASGLLVLACPLMMLFMHAGHGGHDAGGSRAPAKSQGVPLQAGWLSGPMCISVAGGRVRWPGFCGIRSRMVERRLLAAAGRGVG